MTLVLKKLSVASPDALPPSWFRAIPEPAIYVLVVGIGLEPLGVWRVRRRKFQRFQRNVWRRSGLALWRVCAISFAFVEE